MIFDSRRFLEKKMLSVILIKNTIMNGHERWFFTGYRREPKQWTTLGKTQGKVCECVEVTLSISKLFYGPHGIILNSRSHRDDVAVEQSL